MGGRGGVGVGTNHKWKSFNAQLSKSALAGADGMKSGEGGKKEVEEKKKKKAEAIHGVVSGCDE